MGRITRDHNERQFTCVPQMTLYSSVFASPSRLRLAQASGIHCTTPAAHHAAGRCASIEALEAARELGIHFSVIVMQGAASKNKLSVLQFLRAQGCPWSSQTCRLLAESGELAALQWARTQRCSWDRYSISSSAVGSGNLEPVKWVQQQSGVVCDERAMELTAQLGATAMCEFLRSQWCPWSTRACTTAAVFGRVDTLRWLREHGCPWDEADMVPAAVNYRANVELVQHLQQQGLEFTAEMLTGLLQLAGGSSKLAAAKWLRQQGAEWPPVLQRWPAEMLAWATAEGCTSPQQ
jgi:hypothetical protein